MFRRELIEHLRHHGCEFGGALGDHEIYHRPGTELASTIPRHGDLSRALVRAICRDLGIAPPWEEPK